MNGDRIMMRVKMRPSKMDTERAGSCSRVTTMSRITGCAVGSRQRAHMNVNMNMDNISEL